MCSEFQDHNSKLAIVTVSYLVTVLVYVHVCVRVCVCACMCERVPCTTHDLALPWHAVFGHHTYTKMQNGKVSNNFACCWRQLTLNRDSAGHSIHLESASWSSLLLKSFSLLNSIICAQRQPLSLGLFFDPIVSYITFPLGLSFTCSLNSWFYVSITEKRVYDEDVNI